MINPAEFQDLTIGKPDMTKVRAGRGSRKWFAFPLSETPPPGWSNAFEQVAAGGFGSSLHPVEVRGDDIFVECAEGDLQGQYDDARDRVKTANMNYRQGILCQQQNELMQRQKKAAEQARLSDLGDKLK